MAAGTSTSHGTLRMSEVGMDVAVLVGGGKRWGNLVGSGIGRICG